MTQGASTGQGTLSDQLIIAYFKALRAEIDLRIRNYTTLSTAKIVTAGALLAFMLTETSEFGRGVSIMGFMLVPIVSMLYDTLISNNVLNINNMGAFIRDVIEPHSATPLWEQCVAQKSRWSRCYGLADVIVQAGFTFGTLCIIIPILCSRGEETFAQYVWPFLVLFWVVVTAYLSVTFLGFKKPESLEGKISGSTGSRTRREKRL